MTQGARPYVDFWDIKPPLVYETTWALASLSQGNMMTLHSLNVLITGAAVVGTIALTESIAYEVTQNRMASALGASVLLSLPGFYSLFAYGLRPKYLMMLFGLLGVHLQLKEQPRPFFSGLFAVASTFYWLPGIVFVAISLGLSLTSSRRNPRATVLTLVGMVLSGLLVLLPVITWGVLEPMLLEVVFVPILTPENQSLVARIRKLKTHPGVAGVPVLLGTCALLTPYLVRDRLRRSWWMLVGGVWFATQVMLFDYDSYPDLFLTLLFSSFGLTLLVDWFSSGQALRSAVPILTLVTLLPVLIHGVPWAMNSLTTVGTVLVSQQDTPPQDLDEDRSTMQYIYWNKVQPKTCHYRLSRSEKQWMGITGQTGDEQACGQMRLFDIIRRGVGSPEVNDREDLRLESQCRRPLQPRDTQHSTACAVVENGGQRTYP